MFSGSLYKDPFAQSKYKSHHDGITIPSLNSSTMPGQVRTVATLDPDGDLVLVGTALNHDGITSSASRIGNNSIMPGKNVNTSICTVGFLKKKLNIRYIS